MTLFSYLASLLIKVTVRTYVKPHFQESLKRRASHNTLWKGELFTAMLFLVYGHLSLFLILRHLHRQPARNHVIFPLCKVYG